MKFSLAAAILVLLTVVTTTAGQNAAVGTSSGNSATANSAATAPPVQADETYVIAPQDMLNISVWKETELTQTVPVRPDGKISMPLLNDVQAAGLTPVQLKAQITEGLKKFLANPEVTVIVTQINSQRVFIMGEVTHAGAYPLLPQMTILQALSSAGGFTQFANLKKIYMFRMENGKQVNYPFNYRDVIHGKNTNQNVELKAGDTIVVPY
jgi:polysaccharide export outer membrane protein